VLSITGGLAGLTAFTGNTGVGTSTATSRFTVASVNGASSVAFLTVSTSSTALATSTLFIVDGFGNTGVGTSTPFANFAINPVAGQASNQFVVGSSTGTNFIIKNNGNVGIGFTNPTVKLSVAGGLMVGQNTTSSGSSLSGTYISTRVVRNNTDNSSGTVWYKFATLPATGSGNGPLLNIAFDGGGYSRDQKVSFDALIATRDAFIGEITRAAIGSTGMLSSGIEVYQEADNSYTLYIKLTGNYYSAGQVTVKDGSWSMGATFYDIANGSPSNTSTPTGTLVFNSSDTASYENIATNYNSGFTGIGTSSPSAKLAVDGRGVFNQDVRANYFTATSTTATSTFPLLSTNSLSLNGQYVTSLWATSSSDYHFITNLSATTSLASLSTLTGLSNIGSSSGLTNILGNVGIGTAADPSVPLVVNGTVQSLNGTFQGVDTYHRITFANAGNRTDYFEWGDTIANGGGHRFYTGEPMTLRMQIANDGTYFNGNVGIGTTTPYVPLAVVGQVLAEYFTATSTTATSTFPLLSVSALSLNDQYVTSLWATSSSDYHFITSISATSTLNGLNNLEGLATIGSTTGTTTFAGAAIFNGNVGIGTSTANSKLTLAGGNFTHTAAGNPSILATISLGASSQSSYVSGKYAYSAAGTAGLKITDISDPSTPVSISSYDTSGNATDVAVSGKYAYVADGASGLQIIDISNIKVPNLIGTYDTTGNANSVYVSGKYAYIAGGNAGLQAIDISNPSAPIQVGVYDTLGLATEVFVVGKYAYIAGYSAGLQIIDVSDPTAPNLVGTYDTAGGSYGVYVSGKYAYVADDTGGLQIINISTPTAPTLVGGYNTGITGANVYVSGKYAYLTDYTNDALIVFDVSNPATPKIVGSLSGVTSTPWGVVVSGKYAFISSLGGNSLQIIDINGIETPALYAGNINTNALTVTENVDIGNNLYIRNGLNVGQGGIFTDGALTVTGTSSASYFGGNLGVGTTSALARLDVFNSLGGTAPLFSVASSTSGAGTTTALYITSNGNVGVGTTSPFATFAINPVAGTALNQFVVGSSTASSFLINNTGNVSVGTTSGTYRMTIDGGTSAAALLVTAKTGSANSGVLFDLANYGGGPTGIRFIRYPTAGGVAAWTMGQDSLNNDAFTIGRGANYINAIASSSKYFALTTTGSLGLGTTSPIARFDMLNIAGGSTPLLSIASSTSGAGTTTALYITSNGNIGVGTTSPAANFHVYNDSANAVSVLNRRAGLFMSQYAGQGSVGLLYDSTGSFIIGSQAVSSMGTTNAFTTRMIITSAGNVGIGTSTPQALLSVIGGNLEIGTTTGSTVGNITIGGARLLNTYTPDIPTGASTNLFFGKNAGNYTLTGTNGQNAGFGAETLANLTTGVNNAIVGFRAGNSITSGSNNAGVGGSACRSITTGLQNTCLGYSTGFTGQVGTVSYSTAIGSGAYTNRSNSMVLGGVAGDYTDVALGTTSPWAKFSIQGAVGSTTVLFDIASSTSAAFATSSLFRVTSSGLVGVGTTSPFATFAINPVAGQALNQFVVGSSTGTSFIINNSGNVGIGSTTPSSKLDVAGFINTDQYSGFKQAGNTILYASTTNKSILVGQSAGSALRPDGIQNTAVGYEALKIATSTDFNTAIGYQTLMSDIEGGVYNTAVGNQALKSNTTGSDNTASGYISMAANTTGAQNAAYGSYALNSNTSGGLNVAMGYAALTVNTTGGSNTALGYRALRYGLTTAGITAIGYQAGTGPTSITDYNSWNDSYMTFIGYNASRANTVASTSALTNSTAIGYNATVGGSNMMALGGTGAYAVNVGIGTTTPGAKLDIFNTVSSATAPLFSVASSTTGAGTSTALVITANGSVGIGSSTPWRTLSLSGTAAFSGLTTAAGTPNSLCINAVTKEITENAATSCVVSDRDQKQQIQELSVSGLDALRKIQPVTFAYNDRPDRNRIGFIAQDLQAVDDRLGDAFDKNHIARSIDIPAIMSITVKAVKELDTKVTEQASTTAGLLSILKIEKPVQTQSTSTVVTVIDGQTNRIDQLENRIKLLESASTTVATSSVITTIIEATTTASSTIETISNWFVSLGIQIKEGVMHVVALVTDSLKTKSLTVEPDTENLASAGITILDRTTGKPVCMFVADGIMKTELGRCGEKVATTTPEVTLPQATPAVIPEVVVSSTTSIVASSTPEVVVSTSTPVVEVPAPVVSTTSEPVVVSIPEPVPAPEAATSTEPNPQP
jgi:hypothetical protein